MKKIFSTLLIAPILLACSQEPVEFKNTDVSNGLFYLKKTGKPFSGQIKQTPYSSFANPQLTTAINSYFYFLIEPTSVEIKDDSIRINSTCDIEVQDGILNGKVLCEYQNPNPTQESGAIFVEAQYKKGQLTSKITSYRYLLGKKTQVATVAFLDNAHQNADINIYSLNKPEQKLFTVEKRGTKSLQKLYSHSGKLIIETTRVNNQRTLINQYDPTTGEHIGELTFDPKNSLVPYNGYWMKYAMKADQDLQAQFPDAKITEITYYKDGRRPYSESHNDTIFNLSMFKTALKKAIIEDEEYRKNRELMMNENLPEPYPDHPILPNQSEEEQLIIPNEHETDMDFF